MQTLQNPTGFLRWDPMDMSADGLSIVGQAISGNVYRGVIWQPDSGTLLLSTYLESRGLNLLGWVPEDVQAITDDGNSFLCGCFRNGPSGFERAELLFTVPTPPAICLGAGFLALGLRRRR
jgi:hypothetical protein